MYSTSISVRRKPIHGNRACRPSDFSYKHEAKHNSMFVVAEMTDVIRDEEFLALITQIINEATAGLVIFHLPHAQS